MFIHNQDWRLTMASGGPPSTGFRGPEPLLFQTSVAGRPRTCGVIITDDPESPRWLRSHPWLVNLAHHNPDATARGKVVILRWGEAQVFQNSMDGVLTPAFCGNAVAAAAVALGRSVFNVRGFENRRCEVEVRTVDRRVTQSWLIKDRPFTDAAWRGRPVVIMDALNHYAIVGGLPEGVSGEQARRELAGTAPNAKLAVIHTTGRGPLATFYNSNGQHGAVPATGWATLGIARARCRWLADLIPEGCVSYHADDTVRIETLPVAAPAGSGHLRIAMPEVEVDLFALSSRRDAA